VSGWGPVEGSSEHGNEPSSSINFGKLLGGCATGNFPTKTHSAPWSELAVIYIVRFFVGNLETEQSKAKAASLFEREHRSQASEHIVLRKAFLRLGSVKQMNFVKYEHEPPEGSEI
jgi:hypothetical protein